MAIFSQKETDGATKLSREHRAPRGLIALIVAAIAVVPLGGAMALPAAAAGPSAVAAGCAPVLFVGARGSGEYGPGSNNWPRGRQQGDYYGLGGPVNNVYTRLLGDVGPPSGGQRRIEVASVQYGSDDVHTLTHDIPKYFRDLSAGVSYSWNTLVSHARANACPNQQIVLSGYSQGAMVMHRLMHLLGTTSAGQAILARITAVVLIGDGDQVPQDKEIRYGSASPRAAGIGQAFPALSNSSLEKFTTADEPRVLRVCTRGDIVCDYWGVFSIPTGILSHLNYTGSKPLLDAADQAALLVRALPLPTPQNVTLSASVGIPFTYRLRADVAPHDGLVWGVLPSAVLPPGLAISVHGVISGTPTASGSFTFGVQVRAILSTGLDGPWVPATIQLTVGGSSSGGGAVLAWGDNGGGELGDGSTTTGGCFCSALPVPVSLPASLQVTAFAAGTGQSLALTSKGSVLAWGFNYSGQLGNGTTTNSDVPIPVRLPAAVKVTAIAAGGGQSLALTSTGAVLAWGDNHSGELGNGMVSTTGCQCSTLPVPVSLPAGVKVTAIAAGGGGLGDHSLALTSTGSVLAWGNNLEGALGNGTTTTTGCFCSALPVPVSLPAGVAVTAIDASGEHSLALTSTGSVLAWGYNYAGELGNGTRINSDAPAPVTLPAGVKVTAIAGGDDHSLALTSAGSVLAWGANDKGQLGDGTAGTDSYIPIQVGLPPGVTVTAVAGGGVDSFAGTSAGSVLAWGGNFNGGLGIGITTTTGCQCSALPVTVSLPAGVKVTAIATGGQHTLASVR